MPEPQEKGTEEPIATEKPSREQEARQVIQEHADGLREIIMKLRRRFN
jgi:hypothetical protein